MDTTVCPSAA